MADNTLPVSTFSVAARACGLKIAIGAPLTVALLAILGKTIEEGETVRHVLSTAWHDLLWLFALGGNFWGAVTVGGLALSALAWIFCVHTQLPESGEERGKSLLNLLSCIAVISWLLACFALPTTFATFKELTVYQVIAEFVMYAPLFFLSFFLATSFSSN